MWYNLYTIYDTVAHVFYAPSMEINDGSAVRSFIDLMNTDRFKNHKKDYVLYRIGRFETVDGQMNTVDRVHVANGDMFAYEEDDLNV